MLLGQGKKRLSQWKQVIKNWLERKQNSRCAICGRRFEFAGKPHLDHCHRTKKVRGLLCSACNKGLGLFRDDVAVLEAAIAYLRVDRSENPPHPEDQFTTFPTGVLNPRYFNYEGWWSKQMGL